MTYELYREPRDSDGYFATWNKDQLDNISSTLKQEIYERYLVKCEVFNRDSFTCQNTDCKGHDASLTFHHIKWQKNGGKDSARNGATLCGTCHQNYHKCHSPIVFNNGEHLPSHIRGHTFHAHKSDSMFLKRKKRERKVTRKEFKSERTYISWEFLSLLMQWLYKPMT